MSRWHARLAELRASRNEAIPPVQNVQNVQNSPAAPTFEHFEHIEQQTESVESAGALAEPDERAAFIECNGGAPREWAEPLARLDPACPPADMPTKRWLQFINDCGRFVDEGWAASAAALGWGPLDLFGCNRERPLVRYDHMGLLLLLQGRKLIAMTANTATIETATGASQTYFRRPIEPSSAVLAWRLQR